MAQGALKMSNKAAASKSTQRKQTGNRVIKPKKASLLKQHKQRKKLSSGLAAVTEKSLAGKAGHLELLGGGKKDKRREAAAAAAKGNGKGK